MPEHGISALETAQLALLRQTTNSSINQCYSGIWIKHMVDSDAASRLWAMANKLWADTGLRPSQFSGPVLGLIFLRYAEKAYADDVTP